MRKKIDLSTIKWFQIIGAVLALVTFLLGGGFFYNELWKSKILAYSVLPSYDLDDQVFSGLVIENRGRVPLTDVQVIFSNFEFPIEKLSIPGPHEPFKIVSGGEGRKNVSIEISRLSSGSPPLSIYILASGKLKLVEKETFLISSKEVVGMSGEEACNRSFFVINIIVILFAIAIMFFGFSWGRKEMRKTFRMVEERVEKRTIERLSEQLGKQVVLKKETSKKK
jgi:hypothetical protein